MAMHRVRLPSLELSFLPLSLRKGLETPEIQVCQDDGQPYCGIYEPEKGTRGRITLLDNLDHLDGCGFEATLTHEFRHHWQWRNQIFVRDWALPIPAFGVNYWNDIVDYFSFREHEHDALLFDIGIAPSPVHEEWLIRCQKAARGLFADT